MPSNRSRRLLNHALCVLVAAALLQIACAAAGKLTPSGLQPAATAISQPAAAAAEPTTAAPKLPSAEAAPTAVPTIPMPATEVAVEAPPSLLPGEIPAGISFDYQPIAVGTPLEVEAGGRKLSIAVQKVILGSDADSIALTNAPEEMQWIVIQLMVHYLAGEKDVRTQLFESSQFHIVSRGHIDTSQPFLGFVPSPRVDDIKILPGEQSLGYLAFQFYRDDSAPLLRVDLDGKDYFFALTGEWVRKVEPDDQVAFASETGIGTAALPVPPGRGAYVLVDGTVYQVTVNRVLRGFQAWKKISDGFGFNEEPPEGQEYVMPYVSVRVARAAETVSEFGAGAFASSTNGERKTSPLNFFCPLPCFTSASLYPGGTASGWLPLLTYKDDPAPLLVLGGDLYFQLPVEEGTQAGLSPDAIGYSNRAAIHSVLELQQSGPVYAVAFSPDDLTIISGGDDKAVHVWDAATGSELKALQAHKGSVRKLAFSADGSRLASLSNIGEIILWDTQTWEEQQRLTLAGTGIGLKFLPSGELLGADQSGTLRIWDLENPGAPRQESVPRNVSPLCGSATVYSFDASADGSILAAALSCGYGVVWQMGEPGILVGDANHQGELVLRSQPPPTTGKIVLSPNGQLAAYGSVYYPRRYLTLLDIIDVPGKQVVAGVNPIDLNVAAAKIAPNNDLILAGVGKQLLVWWPEAFVWGGTNLIQLSGHKMAVTVIEFSTAGEVLATGDYSGKIILWSAK